MDKLACMHAFIAVADAGGFSRAARQSGQSKALLSKYVAQLEASLDVRLFQRTTRQVSLTGVGQAYYERCKPLLAEFTELDELIQDIHASPTGELRISAPVSFSELHLMQVVSDFGQRYPDIRVTMVLTDRQVDIVEEGFDLALRIGVLADSSLIARHLCEISTVACASPAYLEGHGEPVHPDELKQHRCIVDTNYRDNRHWHFERDGKRTEVAIQGQYRVNSAIAVRELALAGNGIALCPDFVVGDALSSGELRPV
ncbi:MAG TPA: LysR family transcriptional regulator, partial [Gammaproteobacteria bacterium]|nr:LysR family transcriptional regulator [Gammaproteobacteria bacterium]